MGSNKRGQYKESTITIMAGAKFINEMDRLVEETAKGDTPFRRSGRTTRLVDNIIQRMFTEFNEWIYVRDHADVQNAHKHAFFTLLKRIQIEHSWLMSQPELFVVDKANFRVKMVMDPKKLEAIKKKLKG